MLKIGQLFSYLHPLLRRFRRKQTPIKGGTVKTVERPTMLKNEVKVSAVPEIIKNHSVYVFGYGSLLFEHGWEGRGMAHPPAEGDLIECLLKGFERGPWGVYWYTNFYGIIRNSRCQLNGVLGKVHNLWDWMRLMESERIAGLFNYYNYRVVDVTDGITGLGRIELPADAVVHAVCNEPGNKWKFSDTHPAYNYYNYVWEGTTKYRSPKFQDEFLMTGGFKSNDEVWQLLSRANTQETKQK